MCIRDSFKTDGDNVKMLVGVAEIRLRLLGDGCAVLRIALEKLIDLQHGASKFRGGPHLEEVGDRGTLLEFWNMQRGKWDCTRSRRVRFLTGVVRRQ